MNSSILTWFLFFVLLMGQASAQQLGPGHITRSQPSPTRNDSAASYTATGPNGLKTAPQATPGALGACAALAGGFASATPSGETGVRPYFCEGTSWYRVLTRADGAPLQGDMLGALRMLTITAPSGSYGLSLLNGAILDMGTGPGDHFYSNGSSLVFGSIRGGDSSFDTLGPMSTSGNLQLVLPRWLRIFATSANPTTVCTSTDAGGFRVYSTDGNRPWFCDGTTALPLARVPANSGVVDLANIVAGGVSSVQTMTVTGAVSNDKARCEAAGDLGGSLFVSQAWVSAANTVSYYVRNGSAADVDAPSTTFNCWVIR